MLNSSALRKTFAEASDAPISQAMIAWLISPDGEFYAWIKYVETIADSR